MRETTTPEKCAIVVEVARAKGKNGSKIPRDALKFLKTKFRKSERTTQRIGKQYEKQAGVIAPSMKRKKNDCGRKSTLTDRTNK